MNLPIIKLEVEHMRHSMAIALSQYTVQLDEMLQTAINDFCTEENLKRIIENESRRVLDQVLREEVKNWYMHGDGRAVIKASIEKYLRENTTYTWLDEEQK